MSTSVLPPQWLSQTSLRNWSDWTQTHFYPCWRRGIPFGAVGLFVIAKLKITAARTSLPSRQACDQCYPWWIYYGLFFLPISGFWLLPQDEWPVHYCYELLLPSPPPWIPKLFYELWCALDFKMWKFTPWATFFNFASIKMLIITVKYVHRDGCVRNRKVLTDRISTLLHPQQLNYFGIRIV